MRHGRCGGRSSSGVRVLGCAAALAAVAGLAGPAAGQNKSWLPASGQWSVVTNWAPLGLPTPADLVFVGNSAGAANGTATLDVSVQVAGLVISDGMAVDTDSRSLRVLGNTAVTGANTILVGGLPVAVPSRLLLDNVDGLTFSTTDLLITDGGRVHGNGQPYSDINGKLTIGADSWITGNAVFFLDGAGTSFVNDGTIRPSPGSGLEFTRGLVVSEFDLDGTSGNGHLRLDQQGAQLYVTGSALTDSFSGTVTMTSDTTLGMNITEGWVADPGSLIEVTGAGAALPRALIAGGVLTLAGDVNIGGTRGLLRVMTHTTIQPTASLNVGHGGRIEFTDNTFPPSVRINGGEFVLADEASISIAGHAYLDGGSFEIGQFAHLTFGGPAEITGGTVQSDFPLAGIHFSGPTEWNGTLTVNGAVPLSGYLTLYNGPAVVVGPTVINARTMDMDGGVPYTDWMVNSTLVINADTIDGPHTQNNGVIDGEITIGGGLIPRLTVNLTDPQGWYMGGQMTMSGDLTLFPTRLSGSKMTLSGGLALTGGRAQVTSDVVFGDTSTVSIAAAGILRMRGQTNVVGGAEFPGAGTLQNGPGGVMILGDGASLDQSGLVNDAELRIGGPTGAASVAWFRGTPTATVRFTIDGVAPGAEHDLLIVSSGQAELDGTIEIDHTSLGGGGFAPQVGQEFTVLTAVGGVTGTFDNDPVSAAPGGGTYEWTVVYQPNSVLLRLDRFVPGHCYANCDGSTTPPVLNVSDFICFQTKFAGGSPYANCDGSTTPPILNVSDFICFQSKFAAGCS